MASIDTEETRATEDEYLSLWFAGLEMFCHQVLYVRHIYPKESFCLTRFLGVQCRANRHPEVVEYISNTLKVVVPALLKGASDELSLEIFDQAKIMETLEKYSLCFSKQQLNNRATTATIEQLERDIRDLILSVYTLEGLQSPAWSPSTTFKILLFLPTENENCTELEDALSGGVWFCPNGDASRSEEKRRPVYHMKRSTCKFYFQTNLQEST
jgi:hypothetical protein